MARAAFRIEHRIGIPAPASAVWEVISDLERWAEWNPLYVRAEGQLRIGGPLSLTEAIPGEAHTVIVPSVVDWVPDSQILWRLSQSWGLVKRLRYLEIDSLADESCIFSNGEDWYGRPARYVPPPRRRAMREAFAAMGEAVRDRAVGLWRRQAQAPKSAQA